jgi:EpsI family protein
MNASFLKSKPAIILTAVLLTQAGLLYAMSRKEIVPSIPPLSTLPTQFGSWMLAKEGTVEKEVADVLKADDLLDRTYVSSQLNSQAHMFMAFFKSQRTGQSPHSPKNCLPGAGWVQSVSDSLMIPIEGRPQPIEVNRYVVAKGDQKSLVLYWYQSRDRVVASEYSAKFYVVADAMRYNRTDTALVRVIVPVMNDNVDEAQRSAVNFIQLSFQPIRQHLPA